MAFVQPLMRSGPLDMLDNLTQVDYFILFDRFSPAGFTMPGGFLCPLNSSCPLAASCQFISLIGWCH
jgi:hypothetical protein